MHTVLEDPACRQRNAQRPREPRGPHELHRLFDRVDVHVDEVQRRAQAARGQGATTTRLAASKVHVIISNTSGLYCFLWMWQAWPRRVNPAESSSDAGPLAPYLLTDSVPYTLAASSLARPVAPRVDLWNEGSLLSGPYPRPGSTLG